MRWKAIALVLAGVFELREVQPIAAFSRYVLAYNTATSLFR